MTPPPPQPPPVAMPARTGARAWRYRACLAAFWGVAAFVLLHQLGSFPLEDWDEAVFTEVSREMVRTGDLLTLHYNGAPFFNKPPLYFWFAQLPVRAFGFSEWSARLPGVAFGACTLWATLRLGTALAGPWTGLLAAALLLTNAMFLENGSRHPTPDSLLLFLTVATVWVQVRSRTRPRLRPILGALLGAAVLTKGAAAAPLALVLALNHLAAGDGRRWTWRAYAAAAALGLAVVAPWYLAQSVVNGLAFWHKHVYWSVWQRATQAGAVAATHVHGPLYYVKFMAPQFLYLWPLTIAAGVGVAAAVAGRGRGAPAPVPGDARSPRLVAITLAAMALVPLVLFSAARNKAWWYALPCVPPLCIALAIGTAAAVRGSWRHRLARPALILSGLLLAASAWAHARDTLFRQIRSGVRGYGALAQVSQSVEGHALRLGLANPRVLTTQEFPTMFCYVPIPVDLEGGYGERLQREYEAGTLAGPLLILDKKTIIRELDPRIPVTVLEQDGAWMLVLAGGAPADPPEHP